MSDTFRIPIRWPGPVAARFIDSFAPVRMLMGPVGSGKTTTCLMDAVLKAAAQTPQPDGWRRFKGLVVRDTYRQLEKTTIPSWLRWMPKDGPGSEWLGGEGGRPAKHTLTFDLRGAMIELIMEFIGLNEVKVEDVLRGWEGTWAYLNEADLLDQDVLTFIRGSGRLGRYPPKDAATAQGGPSWWGLVLDMNAPDDQNWTYNKFVEELPEGWEFHRQPSGFEPAAENLAMLPGGARYYEEQAKGQPEWHVRRFIRNEFGYSRVGKPIYAEFNDARHVAPAPLAPVRGLPLVLGFDAGLTPAGTVGQRMPDGQWRVLDEITTAPAESVGPQRFGERVNRLLAEERYRGCVEDLRRGDRFEPGIVAWCDPSAGYGADKEAGELTWIEKVEHETEIRIKPAPTNELIARAEAVRRNLVRTIDGTAPGLLISPTCRVLRKGFNSGYRFRRVQVAGAERYEEKPEKNEWSHVHDALQYQLLGGGEFAEVTGRRERRERLGVLAPAQAEADYNPFTWGG